MFWVTTPFTSPAASRRASARWVSVGSMRPSRPMKSRVNS